MESHGRSWKSNKLSKNEQEKKKSKVEKNNRQVRKPVNSSKKAHILCVIMWENTVNNRLF